jgi:hypothetical protein
MCFFGVKKRHPYRWENRILRVRVIIDYANIGTYHTMRNLALSPYNNQYRATESHEYGKVLIINMIDSFGGF